MVTVTGQLTAGPDGGRGLRLPFEPTEVFGAGRLPVRVVLDGAVQLRTELVDDAGTARVELSKDVVAELGLGVGDQVSVAIEADTDPRPAAWPDALVAALDRDPAAAEVFARLSYSEQSTYAAWVAEVRPASARRERAARVARRLVRGHDRSHRVPRSASRG